MANLALGDQEFTASNGLNFTYSVRGEPYSIHPVILVQCPGWGIGAQYLKAGLEPLEVKFTLVYFHPRGTCGSSRPENRTHMNVFHMAEDLEHFRQHLQLDKYPVMLGHSNGGTIVLAYAEMYPHRVEKLVLIDHRLLGFDDSDGFQRFLLQRKVDVRYEAAYGTAANFRPENDEELRRFVEMTSPIYFFDPEKNVPLYLHSLGTGPMEFWCFESLQLCNKDPETGGRLIEGLPKVMAKTLMIFGRDDAQCTVDNLHQTAKEIPHAQIVILDQCGHFPWLEKPTETFDALERFLTA
ncbi:hypothetical protein AJ80_01962 [Polytolypa hystricis UAMH7299]|uniref:AB hydrolase-1 domain-containing protein n=1 Tax=Polytolypa hystricis (strain UAMH7299) TaxID=1447883 RepID=A0A2B7YRT9_POLH7|nr:hypothetical protein AJ80_01962 [Polytolypa hystricis UAMH7299]